MNDFKKCLEIGKIYERKSLKILLKHKFKGVVMDEGYNPYYDIEAFKNNKKVYIEVKYNSLTHKTKYIFLECSKIDLCPSGISITKSDYYIFFSNYDYWICKTYKVKKVLEDTIRRELKKVKITNATYDDLINYIEHEGLRTKNTVGILINVDDVIKICSYKGIHKMKNKKLFK